MEKQNKILIVEDEQIIAENLRLILNEYGYHFVDVAMDVLEVETLFKNTTYDLVLMDINLGEFNTIDGIDLIKILIKKYTFAYIYVTANADEKTINKAKETKPIGYIVKPFIKTSIYANVEMALSTVKKQVVFNHTYKGRQQQILVSNITHVMSDGSYLTIVTKEGNYVTCRKSLLDFNNLYPTWFIRIHRSTLINKNYIEDYTSKIVRVNSVKLPIGRGYKDTFLQLIKNISIKN